MKGGRSYGEGLYGMAIDSSCKLNDHQTLCDLLKHEEIEAIELFNYDGVGKIVDSKDFKKYVNHLDSYIAKYFKSYMVGFDKVKFFEEIKSIKIIFDIFGKDTAKYTTHLELEFDRFKFIGCLIKSKNGKTMYIVFSKKCENTIENMCFNDTDFTKLNKDVLKILVKMQTKNFAHYDIKPDNIISCSQPIKMFKLIDWGLAGKITGKTFQYANPLCNTPLTFYIAGYPAFMSDKLLNYYTWYLKREFWNSNIFKELYDLLISEFYEIVKLKLSSDKLIEKYGQKLDVIAFGMSLAIIIFYNDLKWEKYKEYIIKLVSFKGFKTAKEASKF
jgi:serine/threonine protein kinase